MGSERSATVKKQSAINGLLPALRAGPFHLLRLLSKAGRYHEPAFRQGPRELQVSPGRLLAEWIGFSRPFPTVPDLRLFAETRDR